MSVGAFTDKTRPPTAAEVANALGTQAGTWDEVVGYLREGRRAKEEYRFYGVNYGWALRFRRGGKALASLYPGKDAFVVQIVLPEPLARSALAGPLGDPAKQAILAANPYAEGRWVFLEVRTQADAADAYRLLDLKTTAT